MNLAEALNYKWGENRKESDEHLKDLKIMIESIFYHTLEGDNKIGWYMNHPLFKEYKEEFIELMRNLGFEVSIDKEGLGDCINLKW